MIEGQLTEEIKYYQTNGVINIGVYGYNLSPNVGISDHVNILREYDKAMGILRQLNTADIFN